MYPMLFFIPNISLRFPTFSLIPSQARVLPALRSDLETLTRVPVDKTPPPFHAPAFPAPPSRSEYAFSSSSSSSNTTENAEEAGLHRKSEVFNGCCHCGAVSYSFLSVPLSQRKIVSCNCSLCSRVRPPPFPPPVPNYSFVRLC